MALLGLLAFEPMSPTLRDIKHLIQHTVRGDSSRREHVRLVEVFQEGIGMVVVVQQGRPTDCIMRKSLMRLRSCLLYWFTY